MIVENMRRLNIPLIVHIHDMRRPATEIGMLM